MHKVCTHRAESREDNEEQTQLSLVCVCVCSLPEGGGGREDNLAFIKPPSSDLLTSFKLP